MILVHTRFYTLEYRKCCSTKHGRRMLYTVLLHPTTPAMGRMTDSLFIATSLNNGWLRVVSQQEQGIFLLSKPSRLTTGPTKPPFQWVLPVAPSMALKQPGYENDCSPPSSTKVKNEWSYTPLPYTSSWHIRETSFCPGYNLSPLFQLWKVYTIKWYKMTNRKYGRVWKEALKAYLTVLSWHSP